MKRYNLVKEFYYDASNGYLAESPTGEWVKWEDVEKEINEWREQHYRLLNTIVEWSDKCSQLEADIKVLSEAVLASHTANYICDRFCTCQACEVARKYSLENVKASE